MDLVEDEWASEQWGDRERERASMLIGLKFLELDFSVGSVCLSLKATVHFSRMQNVHVCWDRMLYGSQFSNYLIAV